MKKRVTGLFLAIVLALSLGVSASAVSLNAIDYNAPQPRAVLYDNDRFSGKASADSTEFTATKGSGNTIRVWYDNQESSSVTVTLYKYGWFGLKEAVLTFDVSGNGDKWDVYTESGADSGTYYINVEANDGGNITGYLRANQIT